MTYTEQERPPAPPHADERPVPLEAAHAPRPPVGARDALVVLALLVIAAWMFRPWQWRPIGFGDVAEYVPLLQHEHSVVGRFVRLTSFYAHTYGRFNPVVFAATAAKWTLFPDDDVAFFSLRFAVMSTVVALAYAVLRRLGTTRTGAALGASLFVVGSTAATTWVTISIGEPLGTVFLLTATLLAAGLATARRWRTRTVLIAVCCALALLCKEMILGVVALPLLIGACRRADGRLARPRADPRTRWLAGAWTLGVVLAGIPVVVVARMPVTRGGFPGAYSLANVKARALLERLATVLTPFSTFYPDERQASALVAVVVLGSAWLGLRAALVHARDGDDRRQVAWQLGIAAVAPVGGVLLYAPWRYFPYFYVLPMLIGTAMLVAWAVTWLQRGGRRTARLVVAALVACLAITALSSRRSTARFAADFRVADAVLRELRRYTDARSFVVLTRMSGPTPWPPPSTSIRAYAAARHGFTLQGPRTAACADPIAEARADAPALVFTSLSDCGVLPAPTVSRRETVRYLHPARLRMTTDSARSDAQLLFAPRAPARR